jgi:hypothetical protein
VQALFVLKEQGVGRVNPESEKMAALFYRLSVDVFLASSRRNVALSPSRLSTISGGLRTIQSDGKA